MAEKLKSADAQNKFLSNEKLRNNIRKDMMMESQNAQSEERGINEEYLESLNSVYESVPYTFKELGYDARYIELLKEKYKFENGKDFKGKDIQHLIDEDFSDWNFVINNVSVGMGSELLKNMSTRSEEEKANALARWKIFNRTPNFDSSGIDDSRAFLDIKFAGKVDLNDEESVQRAKDIGWNGFEITGQLGDFIKGSGTDPLAYLMFGTGAGFAGRALISQGVNKWLAPKVALASAGAAFSGVHNTGLQMVEMSAGAQQWDPSVENEDGEMVGGFTNQKYDVTQTLKSMGYGFALTPAITAVGTIMGPLTRAATSPKQSFNKVVGFMAGDKSEKAAAQGVMLNMEKKLTPKQEGRGTDQVTTELQGYLSQGYNAVDNYFNVAFENLKSAPIKRESIEGLVDRWNTRFGNNFKLSDSWDDLYNNFLLGENANWAIQTKIVNGQATQQRVKINSNVKEVPIIDLARKLRKELYGASQKDKKEFQSNNKDLMGTYTDTLNNIIHKAVKKVDPSQAKKLDTSYRLFKQQTVDSKYGKDLLAMSSDTSTTSTVAFLDKMLDPKFSWTQFNNTIKHFEKLDYIVGNKGKELSGGLRTKIEKAMSTFIMEAPDGAKILTALTRTVNGGQTLKKIFPSLTKELDDIIFMQKNLGDWGGADSVIGNMAMANLGGMTGQSILGKQGALIGPLLSIVQWNKLMNSNYFKNAMVHAYKNKGGTLTSGTRDWLRKSFVGENGKKGLSMPDINKIQDTMWGYMYAGFALRGEDVLDERTKDAASDAYGDLKVQFQSNLNPMIESVKMPVAALTGLSVR